MKQILTMGSALFLCAVLFFILKPLANDSESDVAEQVDQQSAAAEEAVDKIGEFPIRPEQREKLEMIQRERQKSIQGMVPEQLSIPSLGLIADIQPTGVLENGEMGVPDDVDEAGWFEPGFKAGAKGNAVLAGHVDSLNGPAIFYELDTLKVGDTIELAGADNRLMIFKVKELASYETDAAPIEEIFGKSDKRMLNLITCTGDFNRDIGSHEERLVVSAELISDSSMEEKLPQPPAEVKADSFSVSWHAVRDDAIIGYRIYEQDPATGDFKKIDTVSLFDRKRVEIQKDDAKNYFVTSVDVDLNESEKTAAK